MELSLDKIGVLRILLIVVLCGGILLIRPIKTGVSNWQSRFFTLVNAVLYPRTWNAPKPDIQNSISPDQTIEDTLVRLRGRISLGQLNGEKLAEVYFESLHHLTCTFNFKLSEAHDELRRALYRKADPIAVSSVIEKLNLTVSESYLVALDIMKHLDSMMTPLPNLEILMRIDSGGEHCLPVWGCTLAHGRRLASLGRFKDAERILQTIQELELAKLDYAMVRFTGLLEIENYPMAWLELEKIQIQFPELNFTNQKRDFYFVSANIPEIVKLIKNRYEPDPHETKLTWIALLWESEWDSIHEFVKSHRLKAGSDLIELLQYQPKIKGDSPLLDAPLSTEAEKTLLGVLPKESLIRNYLINSSQKLSLTEFKALVILAYHEQKDKHLLASDIFEAFLNQIAPLTNDSNVPALLSILGNQITSSLELSMRIYLKFGLENPETLFEMKGTDEIEMRVSKALLYNHRGLYTEAMQELTPIKSAQGKRLWQLLHIEKFRREKNHTLLEQLLINILSEDPSAIYIAPIADAMLTLGNFTQILEMDRVLMNDDLWVCYILAHLYSGQLERAIYLLKFRPIVSSDWTLIQQLHFGFQNVSKLKDNIQLEVQDRLRNTCESNNELHQWTSELFHSNK